MEKTMMVETTNMMMSMEKMMCEMKCMKMMMNNMMQMDVEMDKAMMVKMNECDGNDEDNYVYDESDEREMLLK